MMCDCCERMSRVISNEKLCYSWLPPAYYGGKVTLPPSPYHFDLTTDEGCYHPGKHGGKVAVHIVFVCVTAVLTLTISTLGF